MRPAAAKSNLRPAPPLPHATVILWGLGERGGGNRTVNLRTKTKTHATCGSQIGSSTCIPPPAKCDCDIMRAGRAGRRKPDRGPAKSNTKTKTRTRATCGSQIESQLQIKYQNQNLCDLRFPNRIFDLHPPPPHVTVILWGLAERGGGSLTVDLGPAKSNTKTKTKIRATCGSQIECSTCTPPAACNCDIMRAGRAERAGRRKPDRESWTCQIEYQNQNPCDLRLPNRIFDLPCPPPGAFDWYYEGWKSWESGEEEAWPWILDLPNRITKPARPAAPKSYIQPAPSSRLLAYTNVATTVWPAPPPLRPLVYTNVATTVWPALPLPRRLAYTNVATTVWPAPPPPRPLVYTNVATTVRPLHPPLPRDLCPTPTSLPLCGLHQRWSSIVDLQPAPKSVDLQPSPKSVDLQPAPKSPTPCDLQLLNWIFDLPSPRPAV